MRPCCHCLHTWVSECWMKFPRVCRFHPQLRVSLWIQCSSSQPAGLHGENHDVLKHKNTKEKQVNMETICRYWVQKHHSRKHNSVLRGKRKHFCVTGIPVSKLQHKRWKSNLPSCSELCRCSPRSQPNTRSFKMPRWRSFWGGGRDFMNVLRNVTSFPCFLHTDEDGTHLESHPLTQQKQILSPHSAKYLVWAPSFAR